MPDYTNEDVLRVCQEVVDNFNIYFYEGVALCCYCDNPVDGKHNECCLLITAKKIIRSIENA